MDRLTRRFYSRDTETVARELLGCRLVHVVDGKRIAGRITETEAYLGVGDAACHTFGHRRTPRTKSMYLPGGHVYVYFIYGMHFCFNVVTKTEKEPEAVLIRAIQPEEGIEEMIRLRGGKPAASEKALSALTNGPAKLCEALAIDRSCDGLDLLGDELFIEKPIRKVSQDLIVAGPRIGVAYAGEAATWPLRFRI